MNHDTERDWSIPHHGVQHRLVAGRQCSITAIEGTITAVVFGRRGSGHVQADAIEWPRTFATVAAARLWCEDTATHGSWSLPEGAGQ